jgi:SAM-dependent methyltransferase
VLDLLSSIPPGRLLEAAAGGGYLSDQLARRGFEVTGLDVVDQWQFPRIPFVVADLDQPLPFEADTFDAAALVEALGYLESPSHLIRELSRVVRPGGVVLITMPNVFSLQSRFRFLLNGTYRWFPHAEYRGESKEELADTYRDPLRVTTLVFNLERAGFRVEKIAFGGSRALAALLPFGWLLQGITRLHNAMRKGRKQTPVVVNSTPALLYTNVGLLARKGTP